MCPRQAHPPVNTSLSTALPRLPRLSALAMPTDMAMLIHLSSTCKTSLQWVKCMEAWSLREKCQWLLAPPARHLCPQVPQALAAARNSRVAKTLLSLLILRLPTISLNACLWLVCRARPGILTLLPGEQWHTNRREPVLIPR
jgi:hypothetical protein